MTIKEVEELAEMPRANIRFYEAEGLLTPTRSANGYRDYSEEDLLVLKKIKLLRSLHMSLEEIKALHTGQQELSVVLEQQIKKLSVDKEDLDKAQTVCETMYRDGSEYESLDAEKYLQNLKNEVSNYTFLQEEQNCEEKPYWDAKEANEDILENVQSPGRRYFARALDQVFYYMLWNCFLMLVLDTSLASRSEGASRLDPFVIMLFTLVLEPLQLTLFGTTLGKWILGLHVWHNDDRKLTFKEAFTRTFQVLFYGMAFNLPGFNWWRLYKSFMVCAGPENLEWEYDTRLILKDEKKRRIFAFITAHVLIIGMVFVADAVAQTPMHRGELTVSQFCENYRRLAEYHGVQSGYILDDNGIWQQKKNNDGHVIIYLFEYGAPSEFIFETDADGKIQKISFIMEEYVGKIPSDEDRRTIARDQIQRQMELATLAFVGAKNEFSQFSFAREKMIETITSNVFSDYSFTEAKVNVNCDVEYEGYSLVENEFLMCGSNQMASFTMKFSMTNQE